MLRILTIRGGVKKIFTTLIFCLRNIHYFNQYDIIISFANPIIGWYALLKRIGLVKAQLYTLVHHYDRFMNLNAGYEKIFFLSREIMRKTKDKYPSLSGKMVYLEWGADLAFYEQTFQEINHDTGQELRLISTGKSSRDLPLIYDVCDKLHIPLTIITDKIYDTANTNVVVSGRKGQNAISYKDLLKYMCKSSISVIPISIGRSPHTLCGLTSFLDALALGQPVIMSNNTNISVDIERLRIGLIYEAGNMTDFEQKVKYMVEHPDYMHECAINARKYAESHDYLKYCKHLEEIIMSDAVKTKR